MKPTSSRLGASTRFVARGTTGQSASTGTRSGCATLKACDTLHGSSPIQAGSTTCSISSPPRPVTVCSFNSNHAGNLPRSAFGDAGEILDARAKDAYRRRLVEIEDDIDQARAIGDTERAAQADAERDFLVRELARAFGLSGRDRRAASASERARAGVTRAIRQAIARIGEHHPQLGEHLNPHHPHRHLLRLPPRPKSTRRVDLVIWSRSASTSARRERPQDSRLAVRPCARRRPRRAHSPEPCRPG